MQNRIDKFLTWLAENTDFGEWDDSVRIEVTSKLVEIMTAPEPKQHKWVFYMNMTACEICGEPIGSGRPCR